MNGESADSPSSMNNRKLFNFGRHKLTQGIRFTKSFSLLSSSFFLCSGAHPDIPHCHAAVIAGGVASPDIVRQRCSRTEPCPLVSPKNTNEPEIGTEIKKGEVH